MSTRNRTSAINELADLTRELQRIERRRVALVEYLREPNPNAIPRDPRVGRATWAEIGQRCGMTAQGAAQRWGTTKHRAAVEVDDE